MIFDGSKIRFRSLPTHEWDEAIRRLLKTQAGSFKYACSKLYPQAHVEVVVNPGADYNHAS